MKRGAKRTLAVEENGFSPAENRRAGLSEDMLMRGWPLVIACLTVLVLMGWAYLGIMIADMISVMDMTEAGPGMGLFNLFNQYAGLPEEARAAIAALCLPTSAATFGMPAVEWGMIDLMKVYLMWLMMALAMMLPSALPMLRAYIREKNGTMAAERDASKNTLLVAVGYLLVWAAYALVATLAQWGLTAANAVSPMMAPLSLAVSASVLIAAGIYQFTPAKWACLNRCWYPYWAFLGKSGAFGALREGVVQGMACLGCCWAVMTVMFAVGVMNIVWIALLGAIMAIEKTFPSFWFPKAIGVFCLAWGMALALAMASGA
ncbi:DUF2182 domain-containing protein [Roseibium sp.]|uniref:DUF2182 domain-containing protein n=1 Tax=Roseibium sp. TaxID=1936156 RepID=UPI003A97873E